MRQQPDARPQGRPGIEPVKVEVGKAHLRIDDARVTSQTVKDAVGRAGFEVVAEA